MCRISILADIGPGGISFHAVIAFALAKNLGRCDNHEDDPKIGELKQL